MSSLINHLSNDTLERTLLPEGFVTACDNVFHAYIPDYQGNIVGVYNSSTNTLEQFTDYYPYGLPHDSVTDCSRYGREQTRMGRSDGRYCGAYLRS